jgi:hypothetical protein
MKPADTNIDLHVTPQVLPFLNEFRPLNASEAKKDVPDFVVRGNDVYARLAVKTESLQHLNKQKETTMSNRCRKICEEKKLKTHTTVSRDVKYEIAKELKVEDLSAYEEFQSGESSYQRISTLLSKLGYSDKPGRKRNVLPAR